MAFSNVYNSACLLNKILIRHIPLKKTKNLINYCLLDCYCCVASFCFLYSQICEFIYYNICEDELPLTNQILQLEFFWIYIQAGITIVFYVIGVAAILYQ